MREDVTKIDFRKRLLLAGMICMISLVSGCGKQAVVNTVNSLDDLTGKKVGVQLKTTGDMYASALENVEVVRFNRGIDAVTALQKGVVDAVIIDDAPANVFISEVSGLKILDEPFADEEYGIAVNKNDSELLADINEALTKMQNDGTLDQIKDAWMMGDVEDTAYESQTQNSYANGVMKMVTNAEFPPYVRTTEDGRIVGIDVDIMTAICDELDMKLEVQNTSFDSLIASVERGVSSVAMSSITITEDRMEHVNFSEPYTKANQVVIVRE